MADSIGSTDHNEGATMKQSALFLGGMLLAIITLGYAVDDRNEQREEYCEMVALYKETRGELGWPDYRDAFDLECK